MVDSLTAFRDEDRKFKIELCRHVYRVPDMFCSQQREEGILAKSKKNGQRSGSSSNFSSVSVWKGYCLGTLLWNWKYSEACYFLPWLDQSLYICGRSWLKRCDNKILWEVRMFCSRACFNILSGGVIAPPSPTISPPLSSKMLLLPLNVKATVRPFK